MYNKVSRTSKQMFVKYQNGQYLHYYILPFGDKIGHYLNRYKREFNCNYRSFHSRDSLYLNSKYKIVIFFSISDNRGFHFQPIEMLSLRHLNHPLWKSLPHSPHMVSL